MNYVLSDIHGNERRFRSVMEQIRLQPEDTLYVLGDVIDRHLGGIRILRKLMKMPNVKMLLGNHEYMMLRALGRPYDKDEEVNSQRLDGSEDFNESYTLIFGHTPTKHYQDSDPLAVWYGDHCIAIDCGSGYPEDLYNGKQGRLACLRLEDGKVFYSE